MLNDIYEKRGTHILVERGDYLVLCGLAALEAKENVFDIDRRARRLICGDGVIKSADTGNVVANCVGGDKQ